MVKQARGLIERALNRPDREIAGKWPDGSSAGALRRLPSGAPRIEGRKRRRIEQPLTLLKVSIVSLAYFLAMRLERPVVMEKEVTRDRAITVCKEPDEIFDASKRHLVGMLVKGAR